MAQGIGMSLVLVLVAMFLARLAAQSDCTNCLCQVLNGGGSSLGINVCKTQALTLPGACNVQTPPISQCNAASPAGSPAGTPDDSSNTVPSGSGSKTVPSTDDGSSDGNSIKLSMTQLIVLFAAAFATLSMH
ncbi:hypothetical protein ACLB2K_041890 [Fragaria x ananassa]